MGLGKREGRPSFFAVKDYQATLQGGKRKKGGRRSFCERDPCKRGVLVAIGKRNKE